MDSSRPGQVEDSGCRDLKMYIRHIIQRARKGCLYIVRIAPRIFSGSGNYIILSRIKPGLIPYAENQGIQMLVIAKFAGEVHIIWSVFGFILTTNASPRWRQERLRGAG